MDWTTVKAGDEIEVGPAIGWREWRYVLRPLRLMSLSYPLKWLPEELREGVPDAHHSGIFAYKKRPERWGWSNIESAGPQDGYVLGRIALWGVVWEHEDERGRPGQLVYRAQYGRPVSFDEARGLRADETLERLRRMFCVIANAEGK